MKRKLNDFNYPPEVKEKIGSIVSKLENNQKVEAEKEIAQLALNLCQEIKKGEILSNYADDYFTLLSIYKGDHFSEIKFDPDIDEIIFEGMILHDPDTEYGADINLMQDLSKKFLEKNA